MKAHFLRLFLLSFLLLSLSYLVPPTALAQEDSPLPTVEPTPVTDQSPAPVPAPPNFEQELSVLRQTYRGQLAEYRDAERSYQIAAQQYVQLNTLVSLESAVQHMKKAMVLRDQVLITYLSILRTQLSFATGINLDQKQVLETEVQTKLTQLKDHLQTAETAANKDEVTLVATNFEVLGEETSETAYKVQTVVATGKMQTVYDKTTSLADEIDKDLVQTTTDIKQGERQRAITEVRVTLGRAKTGIEYLLENQRQSASQNSLQSALTDLNQVYGSLAQALNYLDELLRI